MKTGVYTNEQLMAYGAILSDAAPPHIVARVQSFMHQEGLNSSPRGKKVDIKFPHSSERNRRRPAKIEPGMILWLPRRSQCIRYINTPESLNLLHEGCFEHPVLIYAVNCTKQQVLALTVQSPFSSTAESWDIEALTYHSSQHLAIQQSKPNIQATILVMYAHAVVTYRYIRQRIPTLLFN